MVYICMCVGEKEMQHVSVLQNRFSFFWCVCVVWLVNMLLHFHTNILSHTCRVVSLPAEFVVTKPCCARRHGLFESFLWSERTGTRGVVLCLTERSFSLYTQQEKALMASAYVVVTLYVQRAGHVAWHLKQNSPDLKGNYGVAQLCCKN